MELRDFVRESLKQIMEGVKGAQDDVEDIGGPTDEQRAYVAPSHHPQLALRRGFTVVSFDVEVAATEGEEASGGMGVVVGMVGLGGRSTSREDTRHYSRIQFDVGVRLPTMLSPERTVRRLCAVRWRNPAGDASQPGAARREWPGNKRHPPHGPSRRVFRFNV